MVRKGEGKKNGSNSSSSSSSSSSFTPVDEVLLCAHEYGRRLKSSMGRVLHHKKPKTFSREKERRHRNDIKERERLSFRGHFRSYIQQIPQVRAHFIPSIVGAFWEKVGTSTLGLVLMPRRKEALMVTLCKD